MKILTMNEVAQISGGSVASTVAAVLWAPGIAIAAVASVVMAGPIIMTSFCYQLGKNFANDYWKTPAPVKALPPSFDSPPSPVSPLSVVANE